METLKDVSIIVKWSGKEYPITDLNELDTVAVLKHEIYKSTQVRPERQKLLNLKHKGMHFRANDWSPFWRKRFLSTIFAGKPPADDLKLRDLELKVNFKLMMVGSLESDIEDVCNVPYHNRDIIDDFDVDNDSKSPVQFYNMDVSAVTNIYLLFSIRCWFAWKKWQIRGKVFFGRKKTTKTLDSSGSFGTFRLQLFIDKYPLQNTNAKVLLNDECIN